MQTAIDNYVNGIQQALAPLDKADAREALRLASHKLPCTTKIVKKVGEEQ